MLGNLLTNVGLMYVILIGVNLPASFLGIRFESDSKHRLWFEPPGFVIPIVWFVLFTLLGISRFLLIVANSSESSWWPIALAILCSTYAYYTIGLARVTGISALWFGLWGNLVVILFALVVMFRIHDISPLASYLVFPVVVWTTFATAIVVGQLRMKNLC